jgi:predicted negative regulator of RcsB-dependent stress response
MNRPSAFDKKHIETVNIDGKRSILEELNLPPAVIAFLRNNSKTLIIAGICVVLVILGSGMYKNYTVKQNDKAAAGLAAAMKIEDQTARVGAFSQIIDQYSGTNAALWARLELAHMDYQAGNYDKAMTQYKEVLADLPSDSAMLPLVTYSLGHVCEQLKDFDGGLGYYEALSKIAGFAGEGYLGMGRLYEAKGENAKSIDAYEKYLAFLNENSATGLSEQYRSLVEDKLFRKKSGLAVTK